MSIKAFELVPAVERVKLMSDKAKTQIDCIEVCGKNLYIGTNDCFVVHYLIEEHTNNAGRVSFQCEKQGHKYLAVRKPVVQLKAASALNRIMVLCDNTLSLLNMFDLEPIVSGAKVRSVTYMCLNTNPVRSDPFSVEVCVALKRKQLQFYTVTEDRLIHTRDVALPEPAVTMCVDGLFVCAALTSSYCMVNFDTGHMQDLFPYDTERITPTVNSINKEEFLLNGPSALGMFVTSEGVSQRPPLQWSTSLLCVSFVHPYIVALNDEFITVHSILDHHQKQTIPFQGGRYLGDYEGKIFVSSSKEVYALVQVAWEKQIQALLTDRRVSEALDLAKNSRKTGVSKEKFKKMYRHIEQQAAFIEFSQRNFDEAKSLFKSSRVDVREILSLYPGLLPANASFSRALPALHDLVDINQVCEGDECRVTEYKQFLRFFLEDVRGTQHALGAKKEIDSALLKLYAEVNSPELIPLIAVDCACHVTDCRDTLEQYGRYHALCLLYRTHGEYDHALQYWIRLSDGELEDELFPGFPFVVELLSNLSDHELVWRYVDWALNKDQVIGVKIFTERPPDEPQSERLRPNLVIDHLHKYPQAVLTYLEYLVFQKKLEKEKYHTHLAVLYLDAVLQLYKDGHKDKEQLEIARSKLRHMLQMSNLYRIQLILGKVKETDMYAECAILYGKLEEHDKALRILVHKLKDYVAAETYCLINSEGKEYALRKRLFHILLSVYLDTQYDHKEYLVSPAVALLNSNQSDFDTIKVLQQLPDNWSVGLLAQFLSRSLRLTLNAARTRRIERMLARGENLLLQQAAIDVQKTPVVITDDRMCAVCNRPFSEPTFTRYPNGVICHVTCARSKNVCPVSGRQFGTTGT